MVVAIIKPLWLLQLSTLCPCDCRLFVHAIVDPLLLRSVVVAIRRCRDQSLLQLSLSFTWFESMGLNKLSCCTLSYGRGRHDGSLIAQPILAGQPYSLGVLLYRRIQKECLRGEQNMTTNLSVGLSLGLALPVLITRKRWAC